VGAGGTDPPPDICALGPDWDGAAAGGTDPPPNICVLGPDWDGEAAGGADPAPNICVAFCGVAGACAGAGGTDPPPEICALGPDWDGAATVPNICVGSRVTGSEAAGDGFGPLGAWAGDGAGANGDGAGAAAAATAPNICVDFAPPAPWICWAPSGGTRGFRPPHGSPGRVSDALERPNICVWFLGAGAGAVGAEAPNICVDGRSGAGAVGGDELGRAAGGAGADPNIWVRLASGGRAAGAGAGAEAAAAAPGGYAVNTCPQRVHWTGAPPDGIRRSSSA
ncbi:MAG TPA: hypothetical protein VFA20_28430, partial [Myxococcaceae bacterium]|nr:hypothetical protein [Myxococcaceae bacterium]